MQDTNRTRMSYAELFAAAGRFVVEHGWRSIRLAEVGGGLLVVGLPAAGRGDGDRTARLLTAEELRTLAGGSVEGTSRR